MSFIKQLPTADWPKGVIGHPTAYIGFTPRDLCLRIGIEFDYLDADWGLGEVEQALMETHTGHLYGLIRYPEANYANYTAILTNHKLLEVTEELNEIMCDLGLQSADILWFDLERYRFIPCRLIREDDHGNRVVVAHFDCFPDAYFQKEILEKGGHKQSYFIEMDVQKEKGWTGMWKAKV